MMLKFPELLHDWRMADGMFCRMGSGDKNIAQPQTRKYFSLYVFLENCLQHHTNHLYSIQSHRKYSLGQGIFKLYSQA